MEIDFYPAYSQAASEALVDVVAAPEKYQPAAVAMAREILEGRGVDVEAALQEWKAARAQAAFAARPAANGSKAFRTLNVTVFDEEVDAPTESPATQRWIRGLLIFLAADALVRLVTTGRFLRTLISYWDFADEFVWAWGTLAWSVAVTAGVSAAIILVLRRQRIGWMLCAAIYTVPVLDIVLRMVYVFFASHFHALADFSPGDIWSLLGTAVVLTIVLRRDVRGALGAVERTDLITAACVAAAVAAVRIIIGFI